MSWIDWAVIAAFLACTTLAGHLLKGKAKGMDGFFLGGRSLPWWAVSCSIMASQQHSKFTNAHGLLLQQSPIYVGFHSHGGTPIYGWFMMQNPIEMDYLGVPPFQETTKTFFTIMVVTLQYIATIMVDE